MATNTALGLSVRVDSFREFFHTVDGVVVVLLHVELRDSMNAVTGAFGYTGKYIARRLLMLGESVITLTGHPGRSNEFDASVEAFPFRFDDPDAMAESLSGVRVLYNTYWIRFDHGKTTYDRAVANTCALIRAAEIAG